jgi:hypothetical protein
MELSDIIFEINKIFEDENFGNKNFNEFIKIIQKKDNMKYFYLFFKEFDNEINSKKIKAFLSIYTFLFYPEVINLKKDFRINIEIIKISKINDILFRGLIKKMIQNDENENLDQLKNFFKKKFYEYLDCFNEWLELDKEAVLFNLAVSIIDMENDLEKILEDENSGKNEKLINITKENVEKEKEKMFKRALMVDKENGKMKIVNYYNYIQFESKRFNDDKDINKNDINENGKNKKNKDKNFIKILEKQIELNMKKAYWDIFEKELLKEPPNTDLLAIRINELKELIIKCIPNRNDIHLELDGYLDPEFIIHKIESKMFDNFELEKYITYILGKLTQFQAKEDDLDTLMFEKYIQGLIEKNTSLGSVLKVFFKFVFEKFEKIYMNSILFKENIKKK